MDNFLEASKKYDTIQDLVESEIKYGTARDKGSPCRTLARFRRVIDLAREVLEKILASGRYVKSSIFHILILCVFHLKKIFVFNLTNLIKGTSQKRKEKENLIN